jgi:hypothetical protein
MDDGEAGPRGPGRVTTTPRVERQPRADVAPVAPALGGVAADAARGDRVGAAEREPGARARGAAARQRLPACTTVRIHGWMQH